MFTRRVSVLDHHLQVRSGKASLSLSASVVRRPSLPSISIALFASDPRHLPAVLLTSKGSVAALLLLSQLARLLLTRLPAASQATRRCLIFVLHGCQQEAAAHTWLPLATISLGLPVFTLLPTFLHLPPPSPSPSHASFVLFKPAFLDFDNCQILTRTKARSTLLFATSEAFGATLRGARRQTRVDLSKST